MADSLEVRSKYSGGLQGELSMKVLVKTMIQYSIELFLLSRSFRDDAHSKHQVAGRQLAHGR